MNLGKLPQLAGGIVAAGMMLLVALYAIRPHQTEVSPPLAAGQTASHSVYPSIVVDTPAPATPSPDASPRVLDVDTGKVVPISPTPDGLRAEQRCAAVRKRDSWTGADGWTRRLAHRDGRRPFDARVPRLDRRALRRVAQRG